MLLALLFLVAMFFASRYLLSRYTVRPRLANFVAACLVVSYLLGAASYELIAGGQGRSRSESAAPSPQPSAAVASTPVPARLSAGALERLKPFPGPTALGNIDFFATSVDGTVTATGWAANPVTKAPGSGLMFIIDDHIRLDATSWYGTNREDVAKAFDSTAMDRTGFAAAPLSHAELPAGSHRLSLGVLTSDHLHFYLLPVNKEFRIR